jgi:hypothetical protein
MSSCTAGPRVSVSVNDLQPGVLKGKRIAVGGMRGVAPKWPEQEVKTRVLCSAQRSLQHCLPGTQVLSMPEAFAQPHKSRRGATGSSSSFVQPDYLFWISLEKDIFEYHDSIGYDRGSWLRGARRNYGDNGFSWRENALQQVRTVCSLSDSRSGKIVWQAEVTATKEDLSVNTTSYGYRSPVRLRQHPVEQFWVPMNDCAARALKKPGLFSRKAVQIGSWILFWL